MRIDTKFRFLFVILAKNFYSGIKIKNNVRCINLEKNLIDVLMNDF